MRVLSLVAGALDTLTAWDLPAPLPAPARSASPGARRRSRFVRLRDPGRRVDLVADADYVAPEVAAGGPRTTASNVYALACVLVECLTGAPPFPYDMPALVLNAHRSEPPPRIAAATGLPDPLDRVLQTALDKRPEQRQQTPTGLMRAAQRALGHRRFPLPALAAPPAPRRAKTPQPSPRATAANPPRAAASPRAASPSRRRRSRWPAPSGVGVAAVLLLAGTAGYATATNGPDHRGERAAVRRGRRGAREPEPEASNDAPALEPRDDEARRRARGRAPAAALRAPPRRAGGRRPPPGRVLRRARAALPQPAALDTALASVQRAYHRLATTARTGDAAAFRHVTTKIAEREAALDTILRGIDANA